VLELYSNAAVSWPAFHWPDIAFLVAYSAGILLYYKKPVRPWGYWSLQRDERWIGDGDGGTQRRDNTIVPCLLSQDPAGEYETINNDFPEDLEFRVPVREQPVASFLFPDA
jgi:hypothetical protein